MPVGESLPRGCSETLCLNHATCARLPMISECCQFVLGFRYDRDQGDIGCAGSTHHEMYKFLRLRMLKRFVS